MGELEWEIHIHKTLHTPPILPMFGAGEQLSLSIAHQFLFIFSISENQKEMKECDNQILPKRLVFPRCSEDLKPHL